MRSIIFLLTLTLSGLVFANTDKTSARIDGVAAFLIDRAQENYLYVFEKKIKDNEDIQCFMPNILKTLTISGQGGLKQLINSKSLWREMLIKDLEVLTIRSLAYTLQKKTNIGNHVSDINSRVIIALQNLTVEYNGADVRLVYLPSDADQGHKDIVNGFSEPLEKITAAMGVFKNYASTDNHRTSICAAPVSDISDFKSAVDGLIHADENLKAWLDHWEANKHKIKLNNVGWGEVCRAAGVSDTGNICTDKKSTKKYLEKLFLESTNESTKMIASLVATASNLKKINDKKEEKDVMPTVIQALDLLQKDGVLNPQAFQKFSKYARFFGMLADATTSEEVKGILESFTLPSVSFYLKREEGHHLMLTSYLGLAHNFNEGENTDNKNSGFFVPVGLEYTFDKNVFGLNYDGALSVMVSPFDFGYPVNLKLNGIADDIEFDEIVAPSLTISYGVKEYPVVFGVGIQKGAKSDINGGAENRLLLFVAFDMPLFSLFDL